MGLYETGNDRTELLDHHAKGWSFPVLDDSSVSCVHRSNMSVLHLTDNILSFVKVGNLVVYHGP